MPTSAEADRIAQEDAMMRQIAMQQAAQRQANAVRKDMMGARAGAEDAQVRAAEIQAKAQLEAARIAAGVQSGMSKDIGDRQEKVARIGLEMTDAQKAQQAREERAMDADIGFAAREKVARRIRGNTPTTQPTVHDQVTTGSVVAKAPQRPAYDMTGFNSDVAGIAANVAAARGASNAMGPDDLPAADIWSNGASVRDASGQLRTVAFPGVSSSSTPDRAGVKSVANAGVSTSGVDHVALQKALNMRPEVQASTVAPTTPAPTTAPADDGLSARDLRDVERAALNLGPSVADKASDAEISAAQAEYAATKSPSALAYLKANNIPVRERKLTAMDLESDPIFSSQKSALRSAARQRSSGWIPNLSSTNRKANFNADDALMQMYQAGIEKGFSKEEMKKILQADIVRLNMAEDIQWGLPDTILSDK